MDKKDEALKIKELAEKGDAAQFLEAARRLVPELIDERILAIRDYLEAPEVTEKEWGGAAPKTKRQAVERAIMMADGPSNVIDIMVALNKWGISASESSVRAMAHQLSDAGRVAALGNGLFGKPSERPRDG